MFPTGRVSTGDVSLYGGDPIDKPSPLTTMTSFVEEGKQVWKLITPNVLKYARAHFNCSSLNGVQLEDGGGIGTMGSHLEQTYYKGAMMAGVSAMGQVLSNITLGLMEDSGWYQPDYSVAAHMDWLYQSGCTHVSRRGKCLKKGNTPALFVPRNDAVDFGIKPFCTEKTRKRCIPNRKAMAQCNVIDGITRQSVQYHLGNPYWGGAIEVMDSCPSYSYKVQDCRFSPVIGVGQMSGADSACFDTVVSRPDNGWSTENSGCFKHICTASKLRVFLKRSGGGDGDGGGGGSGGNGFVTNGTNGTNGTNDAERHEEAGYWLDCPLSGGTVRHNNNNGDNNGDHDNRHDDQFDQSILCPPFREFCGKWRGLGIPPPPQINDARPPAVVVSPLPIWSSTCKYKVYRPYTNTTFPRQDQTLRCVDMTCVQLKETHRDQGCCDDYGEGGDINDDDDEGEKFSGHKNSSIYNSSDHSHYKVPTIIRHCQELDRLYTERDCCV